LLLDADAFDLVARSTILLRRRRAIMGKRWRATCVYKLDRDRTVEAHNEIEELGELHELVELGPDWNSIERIEIRLLRRLKDQTLLESADAGDERAHGVIRRCSDA
jgi:hypothetical protein